jgi:hypothetical protein
MNIGLILPAAEKNDTKALPRLLSKMGEFLSSRCLFTSQTIELMDGMAFEVITLNRQTQEILANEGLRKKLKFRLHRYLEEARIWPVLEHPDLNGLYDPHHYAMDEAVVKEIVVNRFQEVLSLIQGVGDLSSKEITVTGGSTHLEHAIAKLVTKVKVMNLLLPEGSLEPSEAELAFMETGIPVHITTDWEVLNRSALWLRFPFDDARFDELPQKYRGIIVDFGEAKIIDTKNRKIFSVYPEFCDRIKRKIGHNILGSWPKGVLESVVISVCSNAWDKSVTDTSIRLGMRLSFKS